MSQHIDIKHKLKGIPKISAFVELIESSTLSIEEKQILHMMYMQNKNLGYIADILGYSESTIKKKHRRILSKIGKLL